MGEDGIVGSVAFDVDRHRDFVGLPGGRSAGLRGEDRTMRLRSGLIALLSAITLLLTFPLSSTPAGAAETPTVSSAVYDATTTLPWTNTEVTGASVYDTTAVTGDGTNIPTGTVTYSLFNGGTCAGTATSTQLPVDLDLLGIAPPCSPTGALEPGTYSFEAAYSGDLVYNPTTSCEPFTVLPANPTAPTITDLPTTAIWAPISGFTATVGGTDSDGITSVISSTPGVCTATGLTVTYVTAGQCTLTAHVAASTGYAAASGTAQSFTIAQATSTAPTITNLPTTATWAPMAGFAATVGGSTNSDGITSVISTTADVCTATGLTVVYVTPGQCTLTAHVAASADYTEASGTAQSFTIAQATPTKPTITNLPASGIYGGGFTAVVTTNGDGTRSVASSTPGRVHSARTGSPSPTSASAPAP